MKTSERWFQLAVFCIALIVGSMMPVRAQVVPPFLVFGASSTASGTGQAIKSTSNALWVTLASMASPFLLADGAVGTPGLSWTNETDLGWFRSGTGVVQFVDGAAAIISQSAAGFIITSTGEYRIGSSGVTSPDIALGRDAAGVLYLKNGSNAQSFRVYGTTTGPKYLSVGHDGTNGVIDTAATSGTLSLAPTNATSVAVGKAFTAIGGIVTTGVVGTPAIVAKARAVAVVNLGTASVATFTVGAADGTFEVGCNVLVTVSTTHSFSCDTTYTDEGNTARTMVMPVAALAGTFVTTGLMTNVTGAGPYESAVMTIRAKAATAITIRTSAGGTFTTVTYNIDGTIKQVG